MHRMIRLAVALGTVLLTLSACSSASGESDDEKVTITSPTDGAVVKVPFTLEWESTVPLGPPDSGEDHVHVYVDGDSNDYTVVGGTKFQIEDLSPGEHEISISLQHADHSPVGPESTITVKVGAGSDSTPDTDPDPSTDDSGGGGYAY